MEKPQILLTNDDGIRSPGLWAAAGTLSGLGYVNVAAPREQFSGAGRSLPITSDGIIQRKQVNVNGKNWEVYAVGGTPAQAVLHAVLEIMPRRPDIAVSGINYGENVGTGITISGTVGAALEAASLGMPALAVSLETKPEHHLSYSEEVDFTTAAHFTALFAKFLLEAQLPADVDILKIDVPANATPQTPWRLTRLGRRSYFKALPPERKSWDQPTLIPYQQAEDHRHEDPLSDIYALRVDRVVSVTPLSLDMTSRIDFEPFENALRSRI